VVEVAVEAVSAVVVQVGMRTQVPRATQAKRPWRLPMVLAVVVARRQLRVAVWVFKASSCIGMCRRA
jgi:hypothetical protein